MGEYICPYCGAHLDPGEECDCIEKEAIEAAACEHRTDQEENGQLQFNIEREVCR